MDNIYKINKVKKSNSFSLGMLPLHFVGVSLAYREEWDMKSASPQWPRKRVLWFCCIMAASAALRQVFIFCSGTPLAFLQN